MDIKILLAANVTREYYADAVNGCGGIATITYLEDKGMDYDGLILCGGNDIDPKYYGEEINGAIDIDYPRDEAEFQLAKTFIDAGKPVMGICRGHQLLNVYFGGTLHQHIESVAEHRMEGPIAQIHEVVALEGSIAEKLYGNRFVVNSIHHQAVKDLGEGLKVTMTSTDGSIVEAFEHESLPIFGVQWHPERMCFYNRREDTVDGAPIFKYFVELCQKVKEQREGAK